MKRGLSLSKYQVRNEGMKEGERREGEEGSEEGRKFQRKGEY